MRSGLPGWESSDLYRVWSAIPGRQVTARRDHHCDRQRQVLGGQTSGPALLCHSPIPLLLLPPGLSGSTVGFPSTSGSGDNFRGPTPLGPPLPEPLFCLGRLEELAEGGEPPVHGNWLPETFGHQVCTIIPVRGRHRPRREILAHRPGEVSGQSMTGMSSLIIWDPDEPALADESPRGLWHSSCARILGIGERDVDLRI